MKHVSQSTDHEYSGKLSNKQFPESSKVVKYDTMSKRQQELYNRLIHGLKIYSDEELFTMNSAKKNKILKRHRDAKSYINLWKQQVVNQKNNTIMTTFFGENPAPEIKFLLSEDFICKKFINTMSLRDLGITKVDVIEKFTALGMLPKEFAEL